MLGTTAAASLALLAPAVTGERYAPEIISATLRLGVFAMIAASRRLARSRLCLSAWATGTQDRPRLPQGPEEKNALH